MLAQGLPARGRLHLVETPQEIIQRAVLVDQLHRPFRADPRHARDVVGGVARQREDIHQAVRRHAPLRLHLLRIEDHPVLPFQPVDLHGRPHELQGILIGRHQIGLQAGRGRLPAERSQQIVRLPAGALEDRDPVGRQQGLDHRELADERLRHRLAAHLVVLILRVPECRPFQVEGDRQVVRPLQLQQAAQHEQEPVDGVRREPLRCAELSDRVEGPIAVGSAINEK